MSAIRIVRKLDSTTPYLPELEPLVGKRVEFTVREEADAESSRPETDVGVNPLRGSVLRDDDPFGPAVPADEWEANH